MKSYRFFSATSLPLLGCTRATASFTSLSLASCGLVRCSMLCRIF